MRLLLSNDDGILAKGLSVLEQAVTPLGDIHVVAPDREQSATSHSLTLHHPLRPVRLGDKRWQWTGPPPTASCWPVKRCSRNVPSSC